MSGKVTIHSADGFGQDLAVVDGNGNKIERISELTVRFNHGEPVIADLTIMGPAINLQATIDEIEIILPCCGSKIMHDCKDTRR